MNLDDHRTVMMCIECGAIRGNHTGNLDDHNFVPSQLEDDVVKPVDRVKAPN